MTIAINGIGLATAQGNTSEILESRSFRMPMELPWGASKSHISRLCYPAAGIALSGVARWQALARAALAEVAGTGKTPLLMASCNGGATENWEEAFETKALLEGTQWADDDLPVFSSSCASGIHALYAARELLMSGAVEEVLVLAADILARSNHENFESLRVLAEEPCTSWQSTSSGFILGEAAVVLRLARAKDDTALTVLHGPELGSDLVEHDGLSSVIETLAPVNATMIFGQGTGPYANDAAELRALGSFVDKNVPISTPLSHFGHTLGASSLLSIALAVVLPSFANSPDSTTDARPICSTGPPWPPPHGFKNILAICRALNGACAATGVGRISKRKTQRRKAGWERSVIPGPLMNPMLKRLASEAYEQRPVDPPDVLILHLEKPLAPPPSAIIGGRLLPSAVLEITPGFASQLIARCWGYTGPALCLVGNVDTDPYGLTNTFRESRQTVYQVKVRGSGDNRAIEWNAR
ncbi:MAG TPA: beta-ketoacyl synthase N-terminal-like domain-containing protein [Pyrinomonadaceae bacterium]|nr:beta-ketoacyl synthase N-terminal-like domain-containing protein [Pyrinomonadaceae bacterium]